MICTNIYVGPSCNEPMPQIMDSEIHNCTSGTTGQGNIGDTCIVTYRLEVHQVNELWSCQDYMVWTLISGNENNNYSSSKLHIK